MKKFLIAVLAGLFLISIVAYATGALIVTPDLVIPGEVVQGIARPRGKVQIGEDELHYKETRVNNLTEAMNFQNATIKNRRFVYLNDNQDIYTVDEDGEFLSFIRAALPLGENAPLPAADISAVDAAIAAAENFGVVLTEEQLEYPDSANDLVDWGGYEVIFKMGKDPRIEDRVIVSLDADYSLFSLVRQNSGIDSMDEVDVTFFDNAFAEYCQGLEMQPAKTNVYYKRYGETITALYSLQFMNEYGSIWIESVSFADVN